MDVQGIWNEEDEVLKKCGGYVGDTSQRNDRAKEKSHGGQFGQYY